MNFLNSLAFLSLLLTASCGSDPDSEEIINRKLIVHFDPRINNVPMHLGDRVATPLNQAIEVSDMNFYLSNLQLERPNGELHELADVVLLKMRPAANGGSWRVLEFDLPQGDFSGISFGLGVSPELNGTQNPDFSTSLFDSTHPLSESNGMYWAWESGYRFFLFEGRCDSTWQTDTNLPMTFALHTGRDTLYRPLPSFPISISASASQPSQVLNFAIDVETIFSNDGQTIDLSSERTFHGAYAQLPLGIKLADNMAASIRLIN